MLCPKCGAQNKDTSKFCQKCGNPLAAQQQSRQQPSYPQQNYQQQNYQQQNYQQQNYQQQNYQQQGYPQQNNQQYGFNYQQYFDQRQNTPVITPVQPPKKGKGKLIALISVALVCCLLIGILIPVLGSNAFKDKKNYTLMIYMCGSNLESESQFASIDFREMMSSGVDTSKVNVLVYTGGAETWYCDIPNNCNTIQHLEQSPSGSLQMRTVDKSSSLNNMGDSATLSGFLSYSEKNYPADRYGLVCWNHGAGPNIGFGMDELFLGDNLTLAELKKALDDSPFHGGKKLDWLGFDACLMSSIEIANAVKDNADYMIASQESEPGLGWNYSFIKELASADDTPGLSKKLIDSYCSYYESFASFARNPDLTLSCMDLSKTDNVVSKLDALFFDMNASLESGSFNTLARERAKYHTFGEMPLDERGWNYDMVDLGDLAENSEKNYGSKATELEAALDEMIVYNRSNLYYASGVSLYYPYEGDEMFSYVGGNSYIGKISPCEGYSTYMSNFTGRWLGDSLLETSDGEYRISVVPQALEQAKQETDSVTLQLTAEQLADYSEASYTVFVKDRFDTSGYVPIIENCAVTPDDKGLITVSRDAEIIEFTDGEFLDYFPVRETSRDENETNYVSTRSRVYATMQYQPAGAMEAVLMKLRAEKDNPELTIKSIDIPAEEITGGNKHSLDDEKWPLFGFSYSDYIPKYSDDNKLLPYTEWEEKQISGVSAVYLNEDLSIKRVKMSESGLTEDFYIQINVRDVHDQVYCSDLVEIKNQSHTETYVQKTEKGELTYEIYTDGATVKSYKGSDSKITIPKTVNGAEVTQIANGAFSSYDSDFKTLYEQMDEIVIENPNTSISFHAFEGSKIKKITLPDGMKKLGEGALANSSFEEIVLPDSLETIGNHAFSHCSSVTKLELPTGIKSIGMGAFSYSYFAQGVSFKGENANYKFDGGVLFTKDGKTLLNYTYTGSNSYTVPEGVEEIAPYAFALDTYIYNMSDDLSFNGTDTSLHEVTISGTVKKIGDFAFAANSKLKKIEIPDSVEYIGHDAFFIDILFYRNSKSLDEVKIGKGVTWIGDQVFSGWNVKSFVVSDENEFYSSKDGRLMNKAGDSEINIQYLNDGKNYPDELAEDAVNPLYDSDTDETATEPQTTAPQQTETTKAAG